MQNTKKEAANNSDQPYDYIKEPLLFRNFRSNPINVHGVWNAVYIVKSKVDRFSDWKKIYNATSATTIIDGNTYVSPSAEINIENFLDYYFPFEAPIFIEKNLDLLIPEKVEKAVDVYPSDVHIQPEHQVVDVDLANILLLQKQAKDTTKLPIDINTQFQTETKAITLQDVSLSKPPVALKEVSSIDLNNIILEEQNNTNTKENPTSVERSDVYNVLQEILLKQKEASSALSNKTSYNSQPIVQTLTQPIELSDLSTTHSPIYEYQTKPIEVSDISINNNDLQVVQKQISDVKLQNIKLNNEIDIQRSIAPILLDNIKTSLAVNIEKEIADINLLDASLTNTLVKKSDAKISIEPISLSNVLTSLHSNIQYQIEPLELNDIFIKKPEVNIVQKQISDIDLLNLSLKKEIADIQTVIEPISLSNITTSLPLVFETKIADINLSNLEINKEVANEIAIQPILLQDLLTKAKEVSERKINDIELSDFILPSNKISEVVETQIQPISLSNISTSLPVNSERQIQDINLSNLEVNKDIFIQNAIEPILLQDLLITTKEVSERIIDDVVLSDLTLVSQNQIEIIQKQIADIELSNILLDVVVNKQKEILPQDVEVQQGTQLLEEPIKEAIYIEKEIPVKVENTVYVPVEINKPFEVIKEVTKYIEVEHYVPAKVIEKDIVKWYDNVSYVELPEKQKTEYIEIQHEVPVEVVKEVNVPVFIEKPVTSFNKNQEIKQDLKLITPSNISISFIEQKPKNKEELKLIQPINIFDNDSSTQSENTELNKEEETEDINKTEIEDEDATVVPITDENDEVDEFDDYEDYDDEDEEEGTTKKRRKRNTKPYLILYNGNRPLSSTNIIDKYQLDNETLGTIPQAPKNLKQRKKTKR